MGSTKDSAARSSTCRQQHVNRLIMGSLLLTAMLVGLATLLPMHQQLRTKAEEYMRFDTRLLVRATENWLVRLEGVAMQISSRSQIRDALAQYNRGEIDLAALQAFSVPRLQDALANAADVAGLIRFAASGQAAIALGEPIPAEVWPLMVTASNPSLELQGPLLLGEQPVVLVASPLSSREQLHLGVDLVAFRLEALRAMLVAIPYHADARVRLVRLDSGLAIAGETAATLRSFGDDPLLLARLRGLPQGQEMPQMIAGAEREPWLSFAQRLPSHPGWAILLQIERDKLYAESRAGLFWPLLDILLLTLIGGGLTFLAVRPLARRLQAQEQDLRLVASVFEHCNEGVLLLDLQQRIIRINPSACRLTGYDAGSLDGHALGSLLVAEDDLPSSDSLWARAAHSGHWQGEVSMLRADGSAFAAWLSLAAVYDENRVAHHFTAVFTDISEEKAEEERIRQLAYYDKLTGLPNRVLAMDRLQQALRKAHRVESVLAVLFLDLDLFKPVNDTYGHLVGDHLLQAVGERMSGTVRESDTVARLGGDEFLILLEDISGVEMATEIAGRLIEALQSPFVVDGHTLQIGASIGIAFSSRDGSDATQLVRCADAAMYAAKEAGRNRFRLSDSQGVGLDVGEMA